MLFIDAETGQAISWLKFDLAKNKITANASLHEYSHNNSRNVEVKITIVPKIKFRSEVDGFKMWV